MAKVNVRFVQQIVSLYIHRVVIGIPTQSCVNYAVRLVFGYLEEVNENENKTSFVNVFDEIDTLLEKYKKGMENLEEDMIGLPACVKVEKETVLSNLITLLEHLKSLKK